MFLTVTLEGKACMAALPTAIEPSTSVVDLHLPAVRDGAEGQGGETRGRSLRKEDPTPRGTQKGCQNQGTTWPV